MYVRPTPAVSPPKLERRRSARSGRDWPFRLRRWRSSLALQVLVLFALVRLAALGISIWQTGLDVAAAEQRAFEDARSVAHLAAGDVEETLADARGVAQALGRLPTFWGGDDAARDQVLALIGASHPTFTALFYFTPDFWEHGASIRPANGARLNMSDRGYAREAVASGQFAATDQAMRGRVVNAPVLAVAMPLREEAASGRGGFLGATLRIERVAALWHQLPLPAGSGVLLVDTRAGRILTSGAPVEAVDDLIAQPDLERIRAGEAAFRATDEAGAERLLAWAAVAGTPWVAVVEVPSAVVLGPIRADANRRTALDLGFTIAAFCLLLLFWRRTMASLQSLQRAAAEWARGRWEHRVGVQGLDELGQLGRGFDFMAEQLQVTTQQREAAVRWNELILHAAGEGIYGVDRRSLATFVNPAVTRLTGYTPEELIGCSPHDVLRHSKPDGTAYPRGACAIHATLQQGVVQQGGDMVFWRKDGTSFPIEYTSTPIHEGGEIVGGVVMFKNVTERQAIERMKDEFVSVVSHELRTPLTSIRGSLGLLAAGVLGPVPDKGQRMLDIAVANTDRLVRLINDILDIERMQSGKVSMDKAACQASALMLQAAGIVQPMANKAEVVLLVSPVRARLWADCDRLTQVLTNLLSNAIKFSPAGETVQLSAERRGPHELVFRVTDRGRGIPADKLESIFERFQQVDASDSRDKGGTGLGLAICRTIVEQHGGRVWAESTPGDGSTFFVAVPLVVNSAIDLDADERARLRLGPTEFLTKTRIGPDQPARTTLGLVRRSSSMERGTPPDDRR